ncbi:MAG: RHS repeat-associated core domain-containing protein, partial [Moorea sp. SIO3G5]|nr:RHS repeat-associated core domain-containing protein [Moorena sp. SIO3G5]
NYEVKRLQQNETTILKRQTLRVMDGDSCVAIFHYWEQDDLQREVEQVGTRKLRYQLDNHLGSVSLEVDDDAQIISYEEYFPYGGTAFIAGKSQQEVKLKEYRYSGKERDDSTGLYYYGARYYAPWLGRWLKPDPAGKVDGLNLYGYVKDNPVKFKDKKGLMKEEEKNDVDQEEMEMIREITDEELSPKSEKINVTMIGEDHRHNQQSMQKITELITDIKNKKGDTKVLVALEGNFTSIYNYEEDGYKKLSTHPGGQKGRKRNIKPVERFEDIKFKGNQVQKKYPVSGINEIVHGMSLEGNSYNNMLNMLSSKEMKGNYVVGVDRKVDEKKMESVHRDNDMYNNIKNTARELMVKEVIVLAGEAHIAGTKDGDKFNFKRLGYLIKDDAEINATMVNPYLKNDPPYESVKSSIERWSKMKR